MSQQESNPSQREVFISYARKNSDFAVPLVDALKARGRDVWFDTEAIPPSVEWWDEIKRGIEEAQAFIAILTQEWFISPVCAFEMAYAIEQNKRIILLNRSKIEPDNVFREFSVLKLEGVLAEILGSRNLLEIARRNYHEVIEKVNWIHVQESDDFNTAIQKLITALDTNIERVRLHTRILTRAREWDRRGRDESYMVGDELREASEWLNLYGDKDPEATDEQRAYIQASLDKETENRNRELALSQRALNRTRLLATSFAVFLVIASGLAVFAFAQQNIAVAERDRANIQAQMSESGRLAVQSLLSSTTGHYDTAMLLGVNALKVADTPVARSSLLTVLQATPRLERFLHGHSDVVRTVAISPDGSTLASAGDDRAIRLWDADGGAAMAVFPSRHAANISAIAFSPDGSQIASADHDGVLIVWDMATSATVGDPLATGDTIYALDWSPDGTLLATGHGEIGVRLWDVSNREQIGGWDEQSEVFALAYSPDGVRLAAGGSDNLVLIWSLADEDAEPLRLTGHTNWVMAVAWSPDSSTVASGGADTTVRLWDTITGETTGRGGDEHTDWVRALAYSPDGETLISAGADNLIFLRDATGRATGDPLRGHADAVLAVAYHPTLRRFVSGGQGGSVILWSDIATPTLVQTLRAHEGEVFASALSDDGTRLFTAGGDNSVLVWEMDNGRITQEPLPSSARVLTVDVAGDLVAYADEAGTITLRDWRLGTEIATIQLGVVVRSVAFSPDETRLAVASDDGMVRVWLLDSLSSPAFELAAHSDWVTGVAWSPDGQSLVSVGQDRQIVVWDATDGAIIHQQADAHQNALTGIAFNPDGSLLATSGRDGAVMLWSIAPEDGGMALADSFTAADDWLTSIAFSPDGATLVTGSRSRAVQLWDVATRQGIGLPFTGHTGMVLSTRFDAEGTRLISTSADATVRVWNIDPAAWVSQACAIANRRLREAELKQFGINAITAVTDCG